MAISTNTMDSQRVQVAAPGTSVAANPQPYENTHTLLVYNRGGNVIRVAIGTAGGAIAIGAGVEIPASSAITLAIGTTTNRAGGNFDPPGRVLVFDAAGGAGDAVVTYLNSIGPS
jgi:hypothetical protein